jgi:hypothetical protein
MNELEYLYLTRAVEALNSPTLSDMDRVKVLRTMSQITAKCAQEIEQNLVDKVDEVLYNTITEQRSEHA